jgi:hypothetical protein
MSKPSEKPPLYELLNPSDTYTFRANSDLVARLVAIVLGQGLYTAVRDGNDVGGFYSNPANWEKDFGNCTIDVVIARNRRDFFEAISSLFIVSVEERDLFEWIMEQLSPSQCSKFIEKWNDQHRSSLNNIFAVAQEIINHMKKEI